MNVSKYHLVFGTLLPSIFLFLTWPSLAVFNFLVWLYSGWEYLKWSYEKMKDGSEELSEVLRQEDVEIANRAKRSRKLHVMLFGPLLSLIVLISLPQGFVALLDALFFSTPVTLYGLALFWVDSQFVPPARRKSFNFVDSRVKVLV